MRSPRGYNIRDLCVVGESECDTTPSSIHNSKNDDLEVKAVVTLQAFVRGYMARKANLRASSSNPMDVEGVVTLQALARGYLTRKTLKVNTASLKTDVKKNLFL